MAGDGIGDMLTNGAYGGGGRLKAAAGINGSQLIICHGCCRHGEKAGAHGGGSVIRENQRKWRNRKQ